MTVTELKEMLETLEEEGHGEDIVRIWDADSEDFAAVTSCIYSGGKDSVVLYCDSDEEEKEEDPHG